MARRKARTVMREAMKAAGLEVKRCAAHGDPLPCSTCDQVFDRAEAQRTLQRRYEAREAHIRYLASGGR